MKGILITVDDEGRCDMKPWEGKGLAELQAAVGGYVECFPTSNDVTVWINEEGKNLGLVPNRLAMDVVLPWDVHKIILTRWDYIAGNVVLTGGTDKRGSTMSLRPQNALWAWRVARAAGITQTP